MTWLIAALMALGAHLISSRTRRCAMAKFAVGALVQLKTGGIHGYVESQIEPDSDHLNTGADGMTVATRYTTKTNYGPPLWMVLNFIRNWHGGGMGFEIQNVKTLSGSGNAQARMTDYTLRDGFEEMKQDALDEGFASGCAPGIFRLLPPTEAVFYCMEITNGRKDIYPR
jgi:hypothetical protein